MAEEALGMNASVQEREREREWEDVLCRMEREICVPIIKRVCRYMKNGFGSVRLDANQKSH